MPNHLPKIRRKKTPAIKTEPERALCQAMVPRVLFDAARTEWQRQGHTAREVIAWALKNYLQACNPKRALAVEKVLHEQG